MSLFCPKCWSKAKCLESRTDPLTNSVRRRFGCLETTCQHRFTSIEIIPGELDLRKGATSTLVKLAWEIYDKLGGEKAEQLFVDEWEARNRKYFEDINARRRAKDADKPNTRKPAASHAWRRSAELIKRVSHVAQIN